MKSLYGNRQYQPLNKKRQLMALDIQLLAWDRHKNVVEKTS